MQSPGIAPYGSWRSPITAELVGGVPVYLAMWIGHLVAEGDAVYGSILHPDEGRVVVSRIWPDGRVDKLTPAPYSVRARVYEYGGPAFAVHEGAIYFSNFPDDRLYRQRPGEAPAPLTASVEGAPVRYGDPVADPWRRRLICTREDHRAAGEPSHTLVSVSMDASAADGMQAAPYGTVLWAGADFVYRPALSPDGRRLAWQAWNHPNMRFFHNQAWVADVLDDGTLANAHPVVPEHGQSVVEVGWGLDGVLYIVSDRDGYWNLYRWNCGEVQPICPMEAEINRPFRFAWTGSGAHSVVAIYRRNGVFAIGRIDTVSGELREYPTPFTFLANPAVAGRWAYVVGCTPLDPPCLARVDLESGAVETVLGSSEVAWPGELAGYLSAPVQVRFPAEDGSIAFGYYYAPANRDFAAPAGERPPLIVEAHGGPTSSHNMALNLPMQFWTSRGFAVLEVDYGGSTGYGRAYRKRLWGHWGEVDVADCVSGARYLVEQGLADRERTIIRGGSAGGFTTFAALAFRDYFRAGSSHFGISDPERWHLDTHKYESHYCETLIGPYPARRDLYLARSPLHHADRINAPLILFQGLEDRVVPPSQSRLIVDALRARGVPVEYIEFAGEAHGFIRAETVAHTLQAELAFFGRVFGFATQA